MLSIDDTANLFLIKVSDDKMMVHLTVKPFDPENVDITVDNVLETLKAKGISFGIKEDAIKAALDKVRQENISVKNALIAEGEQPVHGKDGNIEFLFDANSKTGPIVGSDGRVDYHNTSIIESVKIKQPLARLIDPAPGKPGRNVYGGIVVPIQGKPCVLPVGENAKISDNDPKLLVSCIDGNVRYIGGVVSVKSCYMVDKDVDFGVGNIVSKGTVIVKGSVKSGFKLDVEGDVEVWDTVEDSIIKSKGNILVKGGFIGSGTGKIEAEGDVAVRFARNQTIVANNVKILREAIDCTIYAKNTVKAEGDRLSIAGGLVVAGTLIEVESLGSKKEIYTDVEVGVDYAAQQKQMNTRKETSDLRAALKKVDKELALLHEIKKSKGELTAKHADTFQQLLSRKEEIEKRLRDLPSGETVPVYKDAKVVVYKVVYPGVEIKIGEATMSILEECHNTTFYLFENEIKQSP